MDGLRSSAIRDLLTLTARPDVVSLAGGLPDPELIPRERIREASRTRRSRTRRRSSTARPRAARPARRDRRPGEPTGSAAPVDAADVVVTHGSQQALSLLAQVLLDPGATSSSSRNPPTPVRCRCSGPRRPTSWPSPLDADGMDTDALRGAARDGLRPTLVHTVSNFHNPRGVDAVRRRAGAPGRTGRALRLLGDRGRPVRRDSGSTARRPRPSRRIRTG